MTSQLEVTERWLRDARIELAERVFAPHGYTVPMDVRLRVGSVAGTKGTSRKVLGTYYPGGRCADGIPQIFITAIIDDAPLVLATLAHEIVHSIVPADGHGRQFKACARTIGLDGPLTATRAGEALAPVLAEIARDLGPYPHGAIEPGFKKQTTRQLKHTCPRCGAIYRAPRSNPVPMCAGGTAKHPSHAPVYTDREGAAPGKDGMAA